MCGLLFSTKGRGTATLARLRCFNGPQSYRWVLGAEVYDTVSGTTSVPAPVECYPEDSSDSGQ